MHSCQLANIFNEFEFTTILQLEFEFFICDLASSSSVIFPEFMQSSSSFCRVQGKFKQLFVEFRISSELNQLFRDRVRPGLGKLRPAGRM